MEYSPCQLLMSRTTRTLLSTHERLLWPAVPKNAHKQMMQLKFKQKEYYDRTSKTLPELQCNEIIRIRKPNSPGIWSRAKVQRIGDSPKSYIVTSEDGYI